MLIQCPRCETTFRLDETVLPAEGAKVRCSRCAHVFRPPSPGEMTAPAAVIPDEMEGVVSEPLVETGEAPLSEAAEEEVVATLKRSSSRKFWSLVGLFLLLVLLTVTIRYTYLQILTPDRDFLEVIKQVFFLPSDSKGNQKIRLQDVHGYFRDHPGAGRYFVVEGKIRNEYGDRRTQIWLRGTLRDTTRQVVAHRRVLAGLTLSQEELESSTPRELASRLENPSAAAIPAVSTAPGAQAPFMIVFPPTPHSLSEFSVEVLESRKGSLGIATAR